MKSPIIGGAAGNRAGAAAGQGAGQQHAQSGQPGHPPPGPPVQQGRVGRADDPLAVLGDLLHPPPELLVTHARPPLGCRRRRAAGPRAVRPRASRLFTVPTGSRRWRPISSTGSSTT
ncbi:MAG TPA: hypothetical protein VG846_16465 [Actinomycetota bacterium]|nr:hypothetical protein [Actinomycetota bacterium]